MKIFTDEEFMEMCQEVINSVTVYTQDVHDASVRALDGLLQLAGSEFQRACAHAAYNKIWMPERKTCFCLFE